MPTGSSKGKGAARPGGGEGVRSLSLHRTTPRKIDVKSLYLNIPHKEGIDAVLQRLYHPQEVADQMDIPPHTMSDLLAIVLEQNYFQFTEKNVPPKTRNSHGN